MKIIIITCLLLLSPILGKQYDRTSKQTKKPTIYREYMGECGGWISYTRNKCFRDYKPFLLNFVENCAEVVGVYDPSCSRETDVRD